MFAFFMLVVLASLVLLFVILYKLYRLVENKSPDGLPPGLPWLPITGSYWFLLWGNYDYPHQTIKYYMNKHKSKVVSLWLGGFYTVVASSYESVKEVLTRKEFDGRLNNAYIVTARAFGKQLGIFFTDGPNWKNQRRFALRQMRDFGFGRRMERFESDFAEELTILLDTLRNGPINDEERMILKDGKALFPNVLVPISGNAFLAIFTGERLLREDHGKIREVAKAAATFQRNSDTTGGAILFAPWLRHFAHGFSFPGFAEGSKKITDFVRKCLKTYEVSYIDDADRGFLDTYIKKLRENDKYSGFSEEQLLMVGTDFIFPPLTVSVSVLTTIIKYMMHYPEVMNKVQKEIDAVVGRDRLITLDDRVNLSYTEATIREVMRHASLTPWSIPHRALEDTELAGFNIPANTVMATDLHSMHHDPEFWGDPENVRPERFLKEDGCLGKDHSLPFGAGGRLCPAETFSRQFLFLTFGTLVQNFDFLFVDGEPSSLEDRVPGFVIGPKEFWIRVNPRQ